MFDDTIFVCTIGIGLLPADSIDWTGGYRVIDITVLVARK